jgi:hypothetical protein
VPRLVYSLAVVGSGESECVRLPKPTTAREYPSRGTRTGPELAKKDLK